MNRLYYPVVRHDEAADLLKNHGDFLIRETNAHGRSLSTNFHGKIKNVLFRENAVRLIYLLIPGIRPN